MKNSFSINNREKAKTKKFCKKLQKGKNNIGKAKKENKKHRRKKDEKGRKKKNTS